MNTYLYTYEPSRISMLTTATDDEQTFLDAQKSHLQSFVNTGEGIFAGETTLTDSRHFGMVIFHADDDDSADALVANDPTVRERTMRACRYPLKISLWNSDALALDNAQQHFFYRIQPVRPAMLSAGATEEEGQIMGAHFMYLKDLTERGIFAFAGPTLVLDYSNFGIGLLRADDLASAWEIGNNDPAVQGRVMRLTILPFAIIASDTQYTPE